MQIVLPELADDSVADYLLLLKERNTSVIEFVASLVTAGVYTQDAENPAIPLWTMLRNYATEELKLNVDFTHPKRQIPLNNLAPLIMGFMVTQEEDLSPQGISTIAWLYNAASSLIGDTDQIRIERTERRGYGLYATRLIKQGKSITSYDGMRCSQDAGTTKKLNQIQRNQVLEYGLTLRHPDEPPSMEDWVVDARLFFRIEDAGRFANMEPYQPDGVNRNNAVYLLKGSKAIYAAKRQIHLVASRNILPGEEITVDYGSNYPYELFMGNDGFDRYRPVNRCISCQIKEATSKCSGSGCKAVYCSQECADVDWIGHQLLCE